MSDLTEGEQRGPLFNQLVRSQDEDTVSGLSSGKEIPVVKTNYKDPVSESDF
jgi:hypothetical protein